MRATGVISRFLSLLDVALLLLGMLMLTLTQAQLRAKVGQATATEELTGIAQVDYVYLFAGTFGEQRGRCYALGPKRQLLREVRTDVDDDIKLLLDEPVPGANPKTRVVRLLGSDRGFESRGDAERSAAMENVWGWKVIPIYNIDLESDE